MSCPVAKKGRCINGLRSPRLRALFVAKLGDDLDAELLKVSVERSRRLDVQIVDRDLAGAVRKAPAARDSLLKQDPSAADLIGS